MAEPRFETQSESAGFAGQTFKAAPFSGPALRGCSPSQVPFSPQAPTPAPTPPWLSLCLTLVLRCPCYKAA